jgi:hypothetical protein
LTVILTSTHDCTEGGQQAPAQLFTQQLLLQAVLFNCYNSSSSSSSSWRSRPSTPHRSSTQTLGTGRCAARHSSSFWQGGCRQINGSRWALVLIELTIPSIRHCTVVQPCPTTSLALTPALCISSCRGCNASVVYPSSTLAPHSLSRTSLFLTPTAGCVPVITFHPLTPRKAFALHGWRVGLLNADIHGPSLSPLPSLPPPLACYSEPCSCPCTAPRLEGGAARCRHPWPLTAHHDAPQWRPCSV